jgi:hypothetical protein
MPLPQPATGSELVVSERELEFSFWPVSRTTRRYGLGSRIYASDPWTIIRRSVKNRLPQTQQKPALALIEQAEDFFDAAGSGIRAAKPLLIYYSFLNLAKAFLLTSGERAVVDDAMHGVRDRLHPPPNNTELLGAYLSAQNGPARHAPPGNQKIQIFEELHRALAGANLSASNFDLPVLMPQVLPGHRLWAAGATTTERFLALDKIEIVNDTAAHDLRLRFFVKRDDLKRINLTHQQLLQHTRLAADFREVTSYHAGSICIEQTNPLHYGHRATDHVQELVETIKARLWRTVLKVAPYRKYYLYACPPTEQIQILPQILSIYAVTYYLGSITRYRPHHFDTIIDGRFGPLIESFLIDQPSQFTYLMASEFALQEVAKAEIA